MNMCKFVYLVKEVGDLIKVSFFVVLHVVDELIL